MEQQKQAQKMIANSERRFQPAKVGGTVMVPVPLVDRGSAEFPNVKAVVFQALDMAHRSLDSMIIRFGIYDSSRAKDILYLDFQKAFGRAPHKKLMTKVGALGIIGEISDWFEDWLAKRKQKVINGEESEWTDVKS
ncbi:uncharacterized protein LOC135206770 [Macrobrachium nipponense]|uniref:uncharacterized protein LOC135206770 n=1 Tax=Macrobrachium nipponense TaxID=159736 RepID=UPI0030C85F54